MEDTGAGFFNGNKRIAKWQRLCSKKNIFAKKQVMALLFKVAIYNIKYF